MEVHARLPEEILRPLEKYREWLSSAPIQASLRELIRRKRNPYLEPNADPEAPASRAYLEGLDHRMHAGFPLHLHGLDLNYSRLRSQNDGVAPALLEEIRARDEELDDDLQTYLGAKACALKAFYPEHGHIGWHTNWNAAGYNIIFTHSPTGDGYWRHVQPDADSKLTPDPAKLVHIPDAPGWHCKAGYFGGRDELDRVVWHSAYTREPRLTVSYVIYERAIWEDMVREIRRAAV